MGRPAAARASFNASKIPGVVDDELQDVAPFVKVHLMVKCINIHHFSATRLAGVESRFSILFKQFFQGAQSWFDGMGLLAPCRGCCAAACEVCLFSFASPDVAVLWLALFRSGSLLGRPGAKIQKLR